ncbi:MAG: glycosyltransferase family 4 protein [Arachidicoccus sp.]|nr:glycosyltransferase family 4 protein [Arachidicoccus sp.]
MDLARELDKNDWDVRFYSWLPTKRTKVFNLPAKCNKSLFGILWPFIIIGKLLPKLKWFSSLQLIAQDYITAFYMRKCDVLIAMSGAFVYSLKRAKKKGAIIVLERGSKHILEQKKILESVPALQGKKPVPDIHVKRDLEGYNIADYISIASEHVKNSFIAHNYPESRLFVNPYGTSLSHFYPTIKPTSDAYDVIMVGGWSYRKGCDLIVKAITKLNLRFLHVGGIVDVVFPNDCNFTHIDPVDETLLVNYYAQSKVFVLPSREEGLALVQAQALTCGLPIVCSKDTGGRDLRSFLDDKKWIIEMEETNADCLASSIQLALQLAESQPQGNRNYAKNALQNLTWAAYGKRYSDFLHQIIKKDY